MGCWLWLRCGRSDACFAGGGTTGLHCRTQPLNRIRLGCIWDIEIHGPQSRLCARTPAAITTGIPQTPDSEIAGKLASSSTRRNMPKPSECIDRVDSPSWSFFVLEIGEGVALGRPPAQGILNQFEL